MEFLENTPFGVFIERQHNKILINACKKDLKKLIEQDGNSIPNQYLTNQNGEHINRSSYLAIMAAVVYKRYEDSVRKGRADHGLKVKINTNDERLSSIMFDVIMGLTYAENPDPNPTPIALENYNRSGKMATKITNGLTVPNVFNDSNKVIIKTSEQAMALAGIICDDILDVTTPSFDRLKNEIKEI